MAGDFMAPVGDCTVPVTSGHFGQSLQGRTLMLTPVTATTFHRPMGVGKTAPSLVTCVSADGSEVELVVKFAGGCEAGIGSLLREAVAALMAADLDLPVPEPFLV